MKLLTLFDANEISVCKQQELSTNPDVNTKMDFKLPGRFNYPLLCTFQIVYVWVCVQLLLFTKLISSASES